MYQWLCDLRKDLFGIYFENNVAEFYDRMFPIGTIQIHNGNAYRLIDNNVWTLIEKAEGK